jgi:hypothetical protein
MVDTIYSKDNDLGSRGLPKEEETETAAVFQNKKTEAVGPYHDIIPCVLLRRSWRRDACAYQ